MNLSVVLAVYNEEKNLEECLKSVKNLADEIVVVDGGSTDKTVKIAEKYGAKIIKTDNPPIFHINKQKALEAATCDWILQLDADEIVTQELSEEIKKIIEMPSVDLNKRKIEEKKLNLFLRHQRLVEERDGKLGESMGEINAFFIPRRNSFLGWYLKHGGAYPDGVIRLVRKGKALFPCKSVHEQIKIQGRVSWLENNLFHRSSSSLSIYFRNARRYTDLQAEEFRQKKLPKNLFTMIIYIIIVPGKIFLSLFFRHKGFLDGLAGFLFAFFSSLHPAAAYIKYLKYPK